MPSVFKSDGAAKYTIFYTDENGKRRKKTGFPDKKRSDRLAAQLEERAREIREGLADPAAEKYAAAERKPLADHLADWKATMTDRSGTAKHVELSVDRARRLLAVMCGAAPGELDGKTMTRVQQAEVDVKIGKLIGDTRLSFLEPDEVQAALAAFKNSGRSLQTCNHYRAAIRAFVLWAVKGKRLRANPLSSVTGFNAKKDKRHDRRTISVEELSHLITTAYRGETFMGMTGPERALCYRLAVATGLRFSEIASITPGSFDRDACTVTVAAGYTKNGDTAEQRISQELADDLAAHVEVMASDAQVFPLPPQKGAKMLRFDLAAAGIPYRDAAGLVFDFHALRCEMATLLDASGVSPRTIQKIGRWSSQELVSLYTRPRAADQDAAASKIPSFRPQMDEPEAARMTGTDSTPVLRDATPDATEDGGNCHKSLRPIGFEPITFGSEDRCSIQLSYGRVCTTIIAAATAVATPRAKTGLFFGTRSVGASTPIRSTVRCFA
jgi:integrase